MTVNRIQNVGGFSDFAQNMNQSKSTNTPETSDVHWFSSALRVNETNKTDDNVAERVVSQLSGSSEHLQKLEEKANRALMKASKSSDPKDVVNANRSLSSFYLESLLTTKLISKGTQAIEKLTSLQ